MATRKRENVIGLWQDNEPGGDLVRPWIVSADVFVDGQPEHSTTLHIFAEHQYDAAREKAIEIAIREPARAIETGQYGDRTTIYEPPTTD